MRDAVPGVAPLLVAAGLLVAAACSPEAPEADGTWVGTITTEGDVTTVVNASGSVWGGTARLVEEASIGVESGADEYMFGTVRALYLTEDRIYVVDSQIPIARAYDYEGAFVHAYGGEGQGPGEYTRPDTVAADASGRVYVLGNRLDRINVYAASGEPIETWPFETGSCCTSRIFPLADGAVWKPVDERTDQVGVLRYGAQAVGDFGSLPVLWAPEIEYERATFEGPFGTVTSPFSPFHYSSPAPDGKLVFGASDRYRFGVLASDGSRLVVERYWEPVPVPPEHEEWVRRLTLASLQPAADSRGIELRDDQLTSSQIPDQKPAYRWFIPTLSGEVWLHRLGPSEQLDECAGDPLEVGWVEARASPCWDDGVIIDAFDGDGRYMGEVEVPEELKLHVGKLAIRGRTVAGIAQDEAGTIVVKRYRLVLPGEQGQ